MPVTPLPPLLLAPNTPLAFGTFEKPNTPLPFPPGAELVLSFAPKIPLSLSLLTRLSKPMMCLLCNSPSVADRNWSHATLNPIRVEPRIPVRCWLPVLSVDSTQTKDRRLIPPCGDVDALPRHPLAETYGDANESTRRRWRPWGVCEFCYNRRRRAAEVPLEITIFFCAGRE